MDTAIWSNGFDDVVAAHTALSEVDGEQGRLVIAGQPLHALAGRVPFEGVMARLFAGQFEASLEGPSAGAGGRPPAADALGQARRQAFEAMPLQAATWRHLPAVDAQRALLAHLPDDTSLPAALRLAAGSAVALAAWVRVHAGHEPLPPQPEAGHAADLLRMAGLPAGAAPALALDTYLVTVSDHGLNASTFAARVVASTQAGLASSVLAGLGALKGPLHGGAPGPVLDMLDAIGTPDAAGPWLEAALQRGERLMGFGHRIYRTRDPRADALMAALSALAEAPHAGGRGGRLALAQAVEAAALAALARRQPGRTLATNVEFYTALLLDTLGFERSTFTAVFACGRVLGWLAHAREQARCGRLIRPQSRYVGG